MRDVGRLFLYSAIACAPGRFRGLNVGMASRRAQPTDVGKLYADHASRVFRWVLRFYPRAEAEEVVHEVFVKALERIESFREDASVTTWLYRLTTNHCLNRLRNANRRAELWREHGQAPWTVPCGLADQDTVTFLRQFWRQLDDEHVAIGLHYFVDGMSHAEVARVVGCSPRTVGNRIARLRSLAREAADHHEGAIL